MFPKSLECQREQRWSVCNNGGQAPDGWAGEGKLLQEHLWPVCRRLGSSRGSAFQASILEDPGDLGERYSSRHIHAVGVEDNDQLQGGRWPAEYRRAYSDQIPASNPELPSASAWLVFGASYLPAGVPGVQDAPVHGIWAYREFLDFPAQSLSPQEEARAKSAYMGVYLLLRKADPDYFQAECRPLEAHPSDPYNLPQEAMFLLSASLEFLGEILRNQKLPAAPYFAWVWTSARRGPLREPVCELGSPAYRGPAAAAMVSDWL